LEQFLLSSFIMKRILLWTVAITAPTALLMAQPTFDPVQPNAAPSGFPQDSLLKPAAPADDIWTPQGVGQGFRAGAQEIEASLGAGEETRDLGGKVPHDLMLARVDYGHMLGNRVGVDKWYGGNFEYIQEVFGGWQYRRVSRYLVGTTSLVRYNVTTGTRWVPFLDAGVGGTLTDIGRPDLGSLGEFNGQIGPGLHYFWRDNMAFTLQYRYMHTSNAGIQSPNQGVNEHICYLGLSWFF
jgi:opacity protein-like surface antigen